MQNKNLIAIYSNRNETIILPVENGTPVGKEDYFENGGRDYDDYDLDISPLPVQIVSRISVSY